MTTESRPEDEVTPVEPPLTPEQREILADLRGLMADLRARGDAMRVERLRLRRGGGMDRI